VTGGNVFDFEPIRERGDDALDVGIGCDNKMKAASDEVNAETDRSCSFNDFVDAEMGTANHDHQSFGSIDDQGKFAQFESARLIGYCDIVQSS
jgi:hypothetical protein